MRIINSTCYNTDDIRELWVAAIAATGNETLARLWSFGHQELHVAYYTPSADTIKRARRPLKSREYREYARIQTNYKGNSSIVRLGIVRRTKLHKSPLEKIATAAQDELVVPKVVLQAVAVVVWRELARQLSPPDGWIDDFKIRYVTRIKRGMLTEAKQRQKELIVAQKQRRVRQIERDLAHHRRCIRGLENDKCVIEGQIAGLTSGG